METRTIIGLPIWIFTDSIMKISFVNILTSTHIEVVKIAKHIDEYKHADLLKGVHIIEIDIIKTKKNWILKDIVQTQKLFQLQKYDDFMKHRDIMHMLKAYTTQEQEVTVLPFLIQKIAHHPLSSLNMKDFESELLGKLGFADKNDSRSISRIKDDSGIL